MNDIVVSVKEVEGGGEVRRAEYVKDDGFVVYWDWKGWGVAGVRVGVRILLEQLVDPCEAGEECCSLRSF